MQRNELSIWVFFLLLVSIIRLLMANFLPVLPDEAYYWTWSQNLDFSYYDQGPGVALWIWFFVSLFGNSIVSLKLASIIASSLSLFFCMLSSIELQTSKASRFILLLLGIFIPGFFWGSLVIMHDSVLLLFWSIGIYFVLRYLRTNSLFDFIIIFICLGLGTLAKHTMVLFAFALLLFAIFSKEQRRIFIQPRFILGILVGFIVISPMIYWNQLHDWDQVEAILNLRSSGGQQSDRITTASYLSGLLLTISPILCLTLYGICFYLIFAKSSNNNLKVNFLIWITLLPLVFFLILSLKKEIQANWVFPSFLSGILLISYGWDYSEKSLSAKTSKIIHSTIGIGIGLAILMNSAVFFGKEISVAFRGKIEPYFTPQYRFAGYKEAILAIQKFQNENAKDYELISNKYQDSSIASWYLEGNPYVPSMNLLQKNQFSYYPSIQKGGNYLLFHIQENTCEKSFVIYKPSLEYMFEKVEQFPEQDIILDGYVVKRYQIWKLTNFKKRWEPVFLDLLQTTLLDLFLPTLTIPKDGKFTPDSKDTIKGLEMFYDLYLSKGGSEECSAY
jgi:hypothetical protein